MYVSVGFLVCVINLIEFRLSYKKRKKKLHVRFVPYSFFLAIRNYNPNILISDMKKNYICIKVGIFKAAIISGLTRFFWSAINQQVNNIDLYEVKQCDKHSKQNLLLFKLMFISEQIDVFAQLYQEALKLLRLTFSILVIIFYRPLTMLKWTPILYDSPFQKLHHLTPALRHTGDYVLYSAAIFWGTVWGFQWVYSATETFFNFP